MSIVFILLIIVIFIKFVIIFNISILMMII